MMSLQEIKSLYILILNIFSQVTKGTSTTEDGIFEDDKKKPLAKGPDPSLRKGPNLLNLMYVRVSLNFTFNLLLIHF